MPIKQDLALAWRILGSTRIYVALVGIVVIVLAAVGLWHLFLPASEPHSPAQSSPTNTAIASVSPGIEQSLSRRSLGEGGSPAAAISPSAAGVSSTTPSPSPSERVVAITDVRQEQRRGPRGETFVIATIGLASRTDVDALEIRISFFDLTPSNEMRPTDAQVTYRWLTPVRDWSDPTPKFLTATYFKPRPPPWVRDRLRYGGFVVRFYSDGRLQDERSQPESLLAELNRDAPAPQELASAPAAPSPPSATPLSRPALRDGSPTPPDLSRRSPARRDEGGNLPSGKVVPGKPGFVSSPYDSKFLIDVRGFPPGTLVIDPNTNKPFRVP